MKEREIEHHIRKQTRNMKPVDAMIFREDSFNQLQEKEKRNQSLDLENKLTEKLMESYLPDVEDEIDLKKTLKWKNFKKIAKHKKLLDMKRLVEKWMGREKRDIRPKIEARRQQMIKKLKTHQK
jgi:hypothetical protein